MRFATSHVTLYYVNYSKAKYSVNRQSTANVQEFSRFITYECIKDSTIEEKADIETFVITGGNMAKTAICNQKLSSFSITCVAGYTHIFLVRSVSHPNTQIKPKTVRRLATASILSISYLLT